MTALIWASYIGHIEIVKLLLAQKGKDINAKNFCLFCTMFILLIRNLKAIFGIYSNYLKQHF